MHASLCFRFLGVKFGRLLQRDVWVTVRRVHTNLDEYLDTLRKVERPRPLCRVVASANLGYWHPSMTFGDIPGYIWSYGQSPSHSISMDRLLESRVSIRCVSFDDIGTQLPGIAVPGPRSQNAL
jgi:hypothetical protein